MLARDPMVHVRRATDADARGIAVLHARSETHTLALVRGRGVTTSPPIDQEETIWAASLRLMSGDHRPWLAWQGDRTIGFVTAGPSRDDDATLAVGEVYVFDLEAGDATGATASTLLEHACGDLARHGFRQATIWAPARDIRMRELMRAAGWVPDRARRLERLHGVHVLEFRYRRSITE